MPHPVHVLVDVLVETVAKSRPATQAAAHSIYCHDTAAHYIMLSQSGCPSHHQSQRVNAFLKRTGNYVFTGALLYSIEDLLKKADSRVQTLWANAKPCSLPSFHFMPNNRPNKYHRLLIRK